MKTLHTAHWNLWDATQAVLGGQFIAWNAYAKRRGKIPNRRSSFMPQRTVKKTTTTTNWTLNWQKEGNTKQSRDNRNENRKKFKNEQNQELVLQKNQQRWQIIKL